MYLTVQANQLGGKKHSVQSSCALVFIYIKKMIKVLHTTSALYSIFVEKQYIKIFNIQVVIFVLLFLLALFNESIDLVHESEQTDSVRVQINDPSWSG